MKVFKRNCISRSHGYNAKYFTLKSSRPKQQIPRETLEVQHLLEVVNECLHSRMQLRINQILSKRCIVCPSEPPVCPSCASDEICVLTVQSCTACASASCVSGDGSSGSTQSSASTETESPTTTATTSDGNTSKHSTATSEATSTGITSSTTGVAAAQSSSSSNTPITSSHSNAGLIAGVVVAVVVVLLAAVIAFFLWRRAKHRRGESAHALSEEMTQADGNGAVMQVRVGHSNVSDLPQGHDVHEMRDTKGFMSRNR